MPVVSVDPNHYEHFELKSAPPDGFVTLRPLPFGIKLARRSKATRMMMRQQPVKSRQQAQNQESVFELESHDEWAVAFDFSYCIGEHNLEMAEGQPFDFSNEKNARMAVKQLDPKVGAEIERLITSLNEDEDEEMMEDFMRRHDTLLEEPDDSLNTGGNVAPIGTAQT